MNRLLFEIILNFINDGKINRDLKINIWGEYGGGCVDGVVDFFENFLGTNSIRGDVEKCVDIELCREEDLIIPSSAQSRLYSGTPKSTS